jgi:hypothetical protein
VRSPFHTTRCKCLPWFIYKFMDTCYGHRFLILKMEESLLCLLKLRGLDSRPVPRLECYRRKDMFATGIIKCKISSILQQIIGQQRDRYNFDSVGSLALNSCDDYGYNSGSTTYDAGRRNGLQRHEAASLKRSPEKT